MKINEDFTPEFLEDVEVSTEIDNTIKIEDNINATQKEESYTVSVYEDTTEQMVNASDSSVKAFTNNTPLIILGVVLVVVAGMCLLIGKLKGRRKYG